MKRISHSAAIIAAATFCLHVNGATGQNAEWREGEYPGHDRNGHETAVPQEQHADGNAAAAQAGDGNQRKPETFEGGQSQAAPTSKKEGAASQSTQQRKPETFEGGESKAGPTSETAKGTEPKQ